MDEMRAIVRITLPPITQLRRLTPPLRSSLAAALAGRRSSATGFKR
jgi:hypothetical protein